MFVQVVALGPICDLFLQNPSEVTVAVIATFDWFCEDSSHLTAQLVYVKGRYDDPGYDLRKPTPTFYHIKDSSTPLTA